MTQITDIYDKLGIDPNIKPFDKFYRRGIYRLKVADKSSQDPDNYDHTISELPAKPMYVVELFWGGGEDPYVAVYEAKAEVDDFGLPVLDNDGKWAGYKAYTYIEKDYSGVPNISGDTELSRQQRLYLYPKKDKSKVHKVKHYKDPLYYTPVEEGVDTLTGKRDLGFKEYSTKQIENGQRVINRETGVFICLDDIAWSKPKIDRDELYKYAKRISDESETTPFLELKWSE